MIARIRVLPSSSGPNDWNVIIDSGRTNEPPAVLGPFSLWEAGQVISTLDGNTPAPPNVSATR